jgi:hypothetical protein
MHHPSDSVRLVNRVLSQPDSREGIATLTQPFFSRTADFVIGANDPPDELFAAGRQTLRARLLTLGADEREALLARVLSLCEVTGRAAGGYFGLGALSSHERSHISVIQGDLKRPL